MTMSCICVDLEKQTDDRFQHGNVEVLALSRDALVQQRCHRGDHGVARRHDLHLLHGGPHGWAVCLTRGIEKTPDSLGNEIVRTVVAVWPCLAKGGDRGHDQAGIHVPQDVVAQAEFIEVPRGKRLHEDVSIGYQA